MNGVNKASWPYQAYKTARIKSIQIIIETAEA